MHEEFYSKRSEALKRESQLKTGKGREGIKQRILSKYQ
jgi:hypothetical protein